ncbi:sporulation protein Cse60 [Lysinibacillus sp. OL1_EC]|uniref:sporulation protein Cse60 n=1 Tax=unclassified Lysinibacillus TaxID=2636778 RepID=UPI00103E3EB3|nr:MULTISPECIES: sporulation protein Cse60 [unclassified Lysinibacillus]MCM0627366.1 sporulation protein Cse60 [Lysinibacillus sp. OL1_EC]TBV84876.1 sporulation protein Cse60 [Lysinibacillus sp. OL1]
MSKVKLIANESQIKFEQEVNEFLESVSDEQIISIQYAPTPTAIATHTEFGVYPCVEYSVLIRYKD